VSETSGILESRTERFDAGTCPCSGGWAYSSTGSTTCQTTDSTKNRYGLGLAVGEDRYGHGEAHSTNLEIRTTKGLVLIWMVQLGGFPDESGKAHGVFNNRAMERFDH
jgi:hypothetical protein